MEYLEVCCPGTLVMCPIIYNKYFSVCFKLGQPHYDDVIMDTIASQITSLAIVYSIVYSSAVLRKHQSSASLAFVWGIHRGPVKFPAQRASYAENVSIWWRHHALAGHQTALQINMVSYVYTGIVDSPIIETQSKHYQCFEMNCSNTLPVHLYLELRQTCLGANCANLNEPSLKWCHSLPGSINFLIYVLLSFN